MNEKLKTTLKRKIDVILAYGLLIFLIIFAVVMFFLNIFVSTLSETLSISAIIIAVTALITTFILNIKPTRYQEAQFLQKKGELIKIQFVTISSVKKIPNLSLKERRILLDEIYLNRYILNKNDKNKIEIIYSLIENINEIELMKHIQYFVERENEIQNEYEKIMEKIQISYDLP